MREIKAKARRPSKEEDIRSRRWTRRAQSLERVLWLPSVGLRPTSADVSERVGVVAVAGLLKKETKGLRRKGAWVGREQRTPPRFPPVEVASTIGLRVTAFDEDRRLDDGFTCLAHRIFWSVPDRRVVVPGRDGAS